MSRLTRACTFGIDHPSIYLEDERPDWPLILFCSPGLSPKLLIQKTYFFEQATIPHPCQSKCKPNLNVGNEVPAYPIPFIL